MSSTLSVMRPFGPFIGKFLLPKALIDDINCYVEQTIDNPELLKSADWSHKLVGKVNQEIRIDDNILSNYEKVLSDKVVEYLKHILDLGAINLSVGPWKIERRNAWVVRSFKSDFNPAHIHNNANICMAGFLKVPNWAEELRVDAQDHAPSIGKLAFMHGNTEEWGNNEIMVEPKVGECYIFPSSLTHLVYPFKSEGERRSFSVNFSRVVATNL
jgi:hypothetical protein